MPQPLTEIGILVLITAIYLFLRRVVRRLVQDIADTRHIGELRTAFVLRTLQLGLFAGYFAVILLAMNIEYAQFTIFLTSIMAVLGVALFAQWSILSNLTASLLIFFAFPYRVGDRVKVVDKDDDISGEIEEIGSFHVQIRRDTGDMVHYPNALILQRAVIREPAEARKKSHPRSFRRSTQAPS